MKAKKRKMKRMNDFLVEWGKGDEERAKRVERALKIAKPVKVELARSLLDEWAKRILARQSDIEAAAESVVSALGKKK